MTLLTTAIKSCEIAKAHEERNEFEAAWTLIQDDLQSIDDRTDVGAAHLLLRGGSIATRTAYIPRERARDWLSRSLAIFDREGDNANAVAACYALALNHRTEGTFSEAYIWLEEAGHRVLPEDVESKCKIEILKGICKEDEGKNGEALEIYNAVSQSLEGIKNHNLKAKFYGERAIVKRKLATGANRPELYDEALIDYAGASSQHELAGDERSAAIVKNNTACLLLILGRLNEALEAVNEAIDIYARLKDRQNLAQAKETRAQIRLALGQTREAEADARESVNTLKIGGERALLVESLITEARCNARLGLKAKAFNCFRMAEEVAEFIEFNHGLGLISLAMLEEINDLDIDTRRRHHTIVREKLDVTRDAELADRHAECIRASVELFKIEMGLEVSGKGCFKEGFSLDAAVLAFERQLIVLALEEAEGCQKEAAKLLGISASNLNSKLKNQHKAIKHFQTYGHYRGVKRLSYMDSKPMPNDALKDLGVSEGDALVLKKGCRISSGDVALVRSRGKLYIGIYGQEPGKVTLSPANTEEEYEILELREGSFEFESKVVGYIPRDEVGTANASVRMLATASARLPASWRSF